MPQACLDHAFVFVRDLDVVRRFYEGAFAMRAHPSRHPDLVELSSPWAKVVLHCISEEIWGPAPTEVKWRDQVAYKLSFATADVVAQRQAILDHGGLARDPWTWEGTTYCECTDPEGNVVQIFESPERKARQAKIEAVQAALPLEGPHIRVRAFTAEDVDRRFKLDGPKAAHRRLNAPHHPVPSPRRIEEDRRLHHQFLRHGDDVGGGQRVVIAERGTDRYIGDVVSYPEDPFGGYVGVGINLRDETTWRKGYGSEALGLWVSFLFAQWDLHSVRLATWSGNQGMLGVARKLGFEEQGRLRECIPVDGVWHDEVVFGVLRKAWQEPT
ncbi:MAG: GNAT family N-acetyltransferase [Myxococcota bacterium]